MTDFQSVATRYITAWNEREPNARRKAIELIWADDAQYVDPLTAVEGRSQIEATIAAAQSQFPEFRFRLLGTVDGHHNQCRFGWELGPPDADAPVVGFDVAVVNEEGKLQTVLGFLDRVPAV
jgi:hypothetical protein